MRALQPTWRGLFHQAAAPSQLTARLQRYEKHLHRFAVDLTMGRDGEALLERLLNGLQLGEVFNAPLARLASKSPPEEVAVSRRRQPLEAPAPPSPAAGTQSHPGGLETLADTRSAEVKKYPAAAPFTPEAHPRLARLLKSNTVEGEVAHGRNVPKGWPAGFPDGASALAQLTARLQGSGARSAFLHDVIRTQVEQPSVALFDSNIPSGQEAAAHQAEQSPGRGSLLAADPDSVAQKISKAQDVHTHQAERGLVEQLSPRLGILVDQLTRSSGDTTDGPGVVQGKDERNKAGGPRHAHAFPSTFRKIALDNRAGVPSSGPEVAAAGTIPAAGTTTPRVPPAPPVEAPVKGLRGLLAIAEGRQETDTFSVTPAPAAKGTGLAGLEDEDLATRMGAVLRREAERYGIDIKGTTS